MARGGFRPGAGRPKGSTKPKKAAVRKVIKVLEEGTPPAPDAPMPVRYTSALQFAMAMLNDDTCPMSDKVKLCAVAIPYQHARLEPLATGKKEAQAEKAKEAAAGRFAPPPPPGPSRRFN